MSEKKIDLIAQLLAKAESTTPEEAEALTEHATRLMAKYMIDHATIEARRAKAGHAKEEIIQAYEDMTGSYQKPMLQMWHTIGKAYGPLKFLKGNGKNSVRFYIIGFESDVRQFQALGKSLEVQCIVAMSAWWKLHKDEYTYMTTQRRWEARSAFITAFARGAAKRIEDSKNHAVSEAGPGTELVLSDRSQAVEEHFNRVPQGKARASRGYHDGQASGAGYAAGQNASTGERGVGRGSRSVEA